MVVTERSCAITELLDKARREGELDQFIGKRRWKRYCYGTRLEVTRDPAVFANSWYVTTHNVSGGGVGFWSKQAFLLGEPLFVRERSSGKPTQWLSSHVKYCVLGVNGYLIGVSFDHPSEPDAFGGIHRNATAESSPPSAVRFGPWAPFSSLRSTGGTLAMLTAGVVYTGAILLSRSSLGENAAIGHWCAVGVCLLAASFVVGWLLLSRETRVLLAIQRVTESLSSGTPENAPLPEASTREVAAVRQVILDLGIRWQQQADLERLHRQRLEEISQIKTNVLSMVSHDLRTPLTSIQLYARMLEEDLEAIEEQDQRKFLGVISEECTRLSRLLDDLLEVQRLEKSEIDWPMQVHDLSDTVHTIARAFEPLASSNGLTFLVNCPGKLPGAWVNTDKIAQAVNNLLSNALKFTPQGGAIHLLAKSTSTEVVIGVVDTGRGIPREKWDVIFERFVQISSDSLTSTNGVGLGLYITRQVVERHGGRMWLDSEVGNGTEFYIALPIYAHKPSQALAATTEYVAGRVVVCDADPDLASIMSQELRGHGFDVQLAFCGSRFFELISEQSPDVVICDVVFPDMNCREFLEKLEQIENRSFMLIVHLSGGNYGDLKCLGADIVIRRPVTRFELIEATGIAMFKRMRRGAIVVINTGWGLDGERMSRFLAASDHLPLAVHNTTEAIEYLHKYPVDAVIASVGPEGPLSPTWDALEKEMSPSKHLFALTSLTDGPACRMQSTDRVSLLPYRIGQEEQIVAQIDQYSKARMKEAVT